MSNPSSDNTSSSSRKKMEDAFCEEVGKWGGRAVVAGGVLAAGYAITVMTGDPTPALISHEVAKKSVGA